MTLPALAQTPTDQTAPKEPPPAQTSPAPTSPTQGWPQNKPPAAPQQQQTQAPGQPAAPPASGAPPPAPSANAPIPLPTWFHEIDTANKGEVTRAEFLKYRMKTFDQLDTNHDGKLSLEEFLKVAEPPFTADVPGLPPLEDRRARARAEFQNLDTNRNGFVERAEAEALVHAEFNQYDTDRDNKVTEPELRLIVQRSLQREAEVRQQVESQRRRGTMTINEFIDMQLRSADQLDKSGDGRITQQEWLVIAGPAEGPQAQGLPPYELRKKIALIKFQEMDANKDGIIDRVELTAHAVQQFLQMDLNHDRFINEDEFKKSQEVEQQKMRALVQTLQPAQPAQPRPAPAPAQPRPGNPAAPQPQGLAPGLPQGSR
ncbi:MAG: EF-hand domain-containing protein [Alphaproteobacteria bacterium]|nr:EF-hand domain-containing protein [Alphaproteobacteria bacterium]